MSTPDSATISPTAAVEPRSAPVSAVICSENSIGRDVATGRFTAGNRGRPKGSRNKATLLRDALAGDSERLLHQLVASGTSGDSLALRIAVTRLLPARRDLPVAVELPGIVTVADIATAGARTIAAVGAGELMPTEGLKLVTMLDKMRRALSSAARVTSRATSSRG